MRQEVEIESDNYRGIFVAHRFWGEARRGNCDSSHNVNIWWYEGTGKIIKRKIEEAITFSFRTFRLDEYERWTLREAIVGFPAQENVAKSSVKWSIYRGLPDEITLLQGVYPKIVDFSLERLFRIVLASKEDIPTCYIAQIDEHELIERGWMVGKEGEIRLPDFLGLDS